MKASEHIGGRFHPAFKKIIQAEIDDRQLGDTTEFLKLAIVNFARSPAARAIIKEELVDNMTAAVLQALGITIGAEALNDATSSTKNTPQPMSVEIKSYSTQKRKFRNQTKPFHQ